MLYIRFFRNKLDLIQATRFFLIGIYKSWLKFCPWTKVSGMKPRLASPKQSILFCLCQWHFLWHWLHLWCQSKI